jgi:hypothetical protein
LARAGRRHDIRKLTALVNELNIRPNVMADSSSSSAAPEITLYWLNQSRSQRILWLLEELQLPYTLETAARDSNKFAPVSAQAIHPLGKYPMLSLNGRVLAESGLIIETLVERYGPQLMPDRENEEEWLRYRYYMHYAEGSFMLPLVLWLLLHRIREAGVPFFLKPLTRMVADKVCVMLSLGCIGLMINTDGRSFLAPAVRNSFQVPGRGIVRPGVFCRREVDGS